MRRRRRSRRCSRRRSRVTRCIWRRVAMGRGVGVRSRGWSRWRLRRGGGGRWRGRGGAPPTWSGGSFGSGVRNITIRGVTFTGAVEVAPGSAPLNLVFDGDTWGNVGHAAHEGRLSIAGGGGASGNGVQVKNSTFGPGGCSDG